VGQRVGHMWGGGAAGPRGAEERAPRRRAQPCSPITSGSDREPFLRLPEPLSAAIPPCAGVSGAALPDRRGLQRCWARPKTQERPAAARPARRRGRWRRRATRAAPPPHAAGPRRRPRNPAPRHPPSATPPSSTRRAAGPRSCLRCHPTGAPPGPGPHVTPARSTRPRRPRHRARRCARRCWRRPMTPLSSAPASAASRRRSRWPSLAGSACWCWSRLAGPAGRAGRAQARLSLCSSRPRPRPALPAAPNPAPASAAPRPSTTLPAASPTRSSAANLRGTLECIILVGAGSLKGLSVRFL
jgi:hypothetical protein